MASFFFSGWVYLGIIFLQWGFACMSSWAVSILDKQNLLPPQEAFHASLLLVLNPWQPSVSSVEHHPEALYRMLPFVSSCIRHNACVTQQWDSHGWRMLTAYSPKQNKTRQKASQPWLGTFGGYCSVIIATACTKPHKPLWQSRNNSTKGAVQWYQPAPVYAEFPFPPGTMTLEHGPHFVRSWLIDIWILCFG